MEPIDSVEHRGYTIKVYPDEDPLNPRKEWDNLGVMYCWHGRYDLGDNNPYSSPDDLYAELSKADVVLPLYLYDHSGITINTGEFSDPWDSGQVGYIVAYADAIRKEWNVKRISKQLREKVRDILRSEVKMYDDYLTGNVYGYVIEDAMGNEIDSCWGFYGDTDYMISEAKSMIDYDIEEHGGTQIDNVA